MTPKLPAIRTLGSYFLLVLLIAGCSPASHRNLVGYERFAERPGETAYLRALGDWTQELRLYSRWETSLLMRATFKSVAFREAWTHEHARRFILPQEEAGLRLESELADAARYHEFLIRVWANDSLGGHFEGRSPSWKLRLVGDGSRSVAPLVVRRIKKPSTELLAFFPDIGHHDRVFVVKFPVLGDDGSPLFSSSSPQLALQVAGAVHRGQLVWQEIHSEP